MLRAKPHIDTITSCEHGGVNHAELRGMGLNAAEMLDFSTCCNPYRPPLAVRRAAENIPLGVYPDTDAGDLIEALSSALKLETNNLIACSGSTELIRLASLAYLDGNDCAVIPSPTYGEYELACRLVNARVIRYPLAEQDNFQLDIDRFIRFARQYEPSAIFLCNPNNPTGRYLDRLSIKKLLSAFKKTLIVLDEAYIAFTDNPWNSASLIRASNILIVRSMTKDFGLAALRLGYGIAARSQIDTLKKVRPPWNVNAAAQRAGIAALAQQRFVGLSAARLLRSRKYLYSALAGLGLKVIPGQTNFFLVRVDDAREFRRKLLLKGFMVRDCSSFGLPGYIRIGPRSLDDCRKLVRAIKGVI